MRTMHFSKVFCSEELETASLQQKENAGWAKGKNEKAEPFTNNTSWNHAGYSMNKVMERKRYVSEKGPVQT